MCQIKPEYKYIIAQRIGITQSTLRRMLNVQWYEALKETGYKKQQKLLMPIQIRYLYEKIGFDPSETD